MLNLGLHRRQRLTPLLPGVKLHALSFARPLPSLVLARIGSHSNSARAAEDREQQQSGGLRVRRSSLISLGF